MTTAWSLISFATVTSSELTFMEDLGIFHFNKINNQCHDGSTSRLPLHQQTQRKTFATKVSCSQDNTPNAYRYQRNATQ